MIVNFFLLGAFEAQVGEGDRQTVGDTLAAKILAFLAFRHGFCSRDEITRACWGTVKVDRDTFQKQVSFLRTLLAGMGLSSQDFLMSEPDGLELREGTFTTDITRLSELLQVGMNLNASVADRLSALQEADGLRRGTSWME